MNNTQGHPTLDHMATWLGQHLMMGTAPLARTVIGIPLAVAAFTAGSALQVLALASRARPFPEPYSDGLDEATAELLG